MKICSKCGQSKAIKWYRVYSNVCKVCEYQIKRDKGVKTKNKKLTKEMIALRPKLSYAKIASMYGVDPSNLYKRLKRYERKNSTVSTN